MKSDQDTKKDVRILEISVLVTFSHIEAASNPVATPITKEANKKPVGSESDTHPDLGTA